MDMVILLARTVRLLRFRERESVITTLDKCFVVKLHNQNAGRLAALEFNEPHVLILAFSFNSLRITVLLKELLQGLGRDDVIAETEYREMNCSFGWIDRVGHFVLEPCMARIWRVDL